MPNAVNNRRGEQWDVCQRCGIQFPISQLTKQQGLIVCQRYCVDNLQPLRREKQIADLLVQKTDEGQDLRQVNFGFFTDEKELT